MASTSGVQIEITNPKIGNIASAKQNVSANAGSARQDGLNRGSSRRFSLSHLNSDGGNEEEDLQGCYKTLVDLLTSSTAQVNLFLFWYACVASFSLTSFPSSSHN